LGPIAMRADNATTFGKWTYRLVRDGPQWVLELEQADGWMELYGFTEEPQLPVDYELPNWWTSTHPASPFVQAITVQWPGFDRQLVLRGRELTEFRPDGQTVRLIEGDDELLDVLAAQFGLVFPTGTRFRSPLDAADDAADRSSRTAAKSSNADPH
jgi:N-hydroxyarylamine O-acetyltransferase